MNIHDTSNIDGQSIGIKKQYIFLDESGKPEVYSSRGINLVERGFATRFLVIAAVRVAEHLQIQQQVMAMKSRLLADESLTKIFSPAYSLDAFHATHDYNIVRERFYAFIREEIDAKIDVVVVDKMKCYAPLRENPGRMYGVMAGQLLKNLCHHAGETEVIFSRKDSKLKARKELESEVERARFDFLNGHPGIAASVSLSYQHNPHYSHGGLQVADYIAFAVFKVFESSERRWYEMIKNKIGKIQDICNKKYYTRSNPL